MNSETTGYSFCSLPTVRGYLGVFFTVFFFPLLFFSVFKHSLIYSLAVLFIIGDWNAKVGTQETPGITGKFGLRIRNEAGQRLIEFYQENALVIVNTLFQHERRLYTWTSPDGQHRNQIDYILCSQRWRSSIQSAKTRSGADCGSDHELLISKFRLKLKKVGKTTRPFLRTILKNLRP